MASCDQPIPLVASLGLALPLVASVLVAAVPGGFADLAIFFAEQKTEASTKRAKQKFMREKLSSLGNTTPRIRRIYLIIGTVALPAIWVTISDLNFVKELYFPSPGRVFRAAFDIKPNILLQSLSTIALAVSGYITGILLAFIFGALQRLTPSCRYGLSVVLETMRPVPPVALMPFFIIWFGYQWYGKWILISLGVFLLLYPAIINAIDNMNPIYYRLARTLGATDRQFLIYAAVPAMLPGLLGQFRVALSFSLALAVVSEYMGADLGLGRILNISLSTFSTQSIVLCIILLGAIGYFFDLLLRVVHNSLVQWAYKVDEAIR